MHVTRTSSWSTGAARRTEVVSSTSFANETEIQRTPATQSRLTSRALSFFTRLTTAASTESKFS